MFVLNALFVIAILSLNSADISYVITIIAHHEINNVLEITVVVTWIDNNLFQECDQFI